MRWRWLIPTVAGLVVACGDGGGDGGTGPGPVDIAGVWTWQESVNGQGVVCSDTGTVTLHQTGSTFTGTGRQAGSCSLAGGPPQTFAFDFSVAGGTVSGGTVSFTVDDCPYRGDARGDSLTGTVSCTMEIGDGDLHVSGAWRLVYPPPAVSGTITFPAADTLAVSGDSLSIEVAAESRRTLAWVGYEVEAPISLRDSVAVTGKAATHRFAITASSQGSASARVFARDEVGLQRRPEIGPLVVRGDLIRRPTRSLVLAAPVRDMAVDPAGQRVYLSQPTTRQVVSIDLGTGAYGRTIAAPFVPAGIDLTPGGDSLVLASDSDVRIGIVDLTATSPSVVTRPVAEPPDIGDGATWAGDRLRVLASDQVIMTLTPADHGSCCQGWLTQYDLANGTSVLRTDAGRPGGISSQEPLARAGDGSRLLLVEGGGSPLFAQTFQTANNTFDPLVQMQVSNAPYAVSADLLGTRFLVANAAFDGALQPLITLAMHEYQQGGATILSPDGSTAYVAIYDGYLKIRISDGAVLERVRLPRWAMTFAITPDGNTLIATSGTTQVFGTDERALLVDLR